MNIVYMSQAMAESMNFTHTDAVISITEPGKLAKLTAPSILRLEFDDHDPSDNSNQLMPSYAWDDQHQVLFSNQQAKTIKSFIDECLSRDIDNFYVHCFMGISRSRAVALALREYYNMDTKPEGQWGTANKHVYRVLSDELNEHKLGSAFGERE